MDINNDWKKNLGLFLTSQTFSLFGSMLVQYAITWYITLETKSGMMMTLSIICGFLPTLLISPFAGVWADRYSRKLLIMMSDALIALATLILAILFMLGYDAIWLLFVASAIRSLGSGIQMPAVGAFLPQLVPAEMLTRANGLNSSIQAMVFLLSPMISGVLMGVAPLEAIFFIDVVTAATAIFILLLFLHVPLHARALEKQTTSYFEDMKQGIRYSKNHGFVRTIMLFCAVYFFLVSPMAFLTPLQVARSFGDDIWRLTAIEVAYSAGMMLGGIVIAAWGGFKNRHKTMVLSNFVVALCTVALGIVPVFWIYTALMVLVGFVSPLFSTPFIVLLQEKVEGDFMGRVFGVFSMISSSVMPLAMLLYGPLADLIKIEWLLMGTGVLMIAQSFFLLANKVLSEAGKPMPEIK